ncbi:hypothetical protein ElyMa_002351200 [Elysia marginata]|uniref:Uncharacterized protein n=1 Tax=Elysia marginata TaxID=1093978 RepID=A0AAV4GB31_9GAST|nr:hypothetical protein ElyMa_002351200 [Elysia marginata]
MCGYYTSRLVDTTTYTCGYCKSRLADPATHYLWTSQRKKSGYHNVRVDIPTIPCGNENAIDAARILKSSIYYHVPRCTGHSKCSICSENYMGDAATLIVPGSMEE